MNINFCIHQCNGKTIDVYAQGVTFEDVPDDCTAWAEKVARAALSAVRDVPFERNPVGGLTAKEFREKYLLHNCEKCCATCKHSCDMMDDGEYQCKHPALGDREVLYTEGCDTCVAWERSSR